jgi:hypothetical protein
VRVSMVYPADATPGHLLSVVPSSQLAQLRERERQLALARISQPLAGPATPPPAAPPAQGVRAGRQPVGGPLLPPPDLPSKPPLRPQRPPWQVTPPPPLSGSDYVDRYRRAIEAQRQMMQGWPDP